MHKTLWVAVLLPLLGGLPASSAPQDSPPGYWPTATPESEGFSAARLQKLSGDLTALGTTDFLVIRDDKIIFESYAPGFSRTKPHGTASLAKALVGGDSLMLLMNDGKIKPDDLASQYIPQWAGDPLRSKITIRHLATHTSGVEDAEAADDAVPHDKLTGWKGDFWKRLPPPRDPFTIGRDIAPVMETPGTRARYSNPGMGMLAYCLTVALRGSIDPDLRSLLKHRLLEPLGVPDSEWSVGYGGPITVEGLPLIATWGGAAFSPNASARIGRLLLHEGNWDGRQLIAPAVVHAATSNAGMPNHSGLGWWVNRQPDGQRVWSALPGDAFWGSGAGHQFLLVVPSLNLVVVRNGVTLDSTIPHGDALEKHIVTPLMKCLVSSTPSNTPPSGRASLPTSPSQGPVPSSSPSTGPSGRASLPTSPFLPQPYPQSPIIREVLWAPAKSIIRKAHDSDNWPLTWADDDALYTAYGDGSGFEPFVPQKLSLGFAKVLGSPPDFAGVNIRSSSGEQLGGGSRGKKASGMLMVNGALYLWARNAGNAQLASSSDHGVTWNWCDWQFTNSFGCPTFLNFGPNYADSRDDYVYVFSPDAETAYAPADSLILARVRRGEILNRDAYEFFLGLDNAGHAAWGKDLTERGAVFKAPRGCYRPSVTFDAPLKRYLLAMPLPNQRSHDSRGKIDTRFAGGLAIYDAPEPWGPWTTVFRTNDWDVGPGDSASFPTKWMSPDGRTLNLVFSSEDNFCVRQCHLD